MTIVKLPCPNPTRLLSSLAAPTSSPGSALNALAPPRVLTKAQSPPPVPPRSAAAATAAKQEPGGRPQLVHSMTFTAPELDPSNRFCGRGETVARQEQKRREALWDLFQSEIVFLLDHLMVLRHVRLNSNLAGFSNRSSFTTFFLQVYMEPLKKVQVEGYIMFAEPEVLFGNLDELCCVSFVYLRRYCSRSLRRQKTDEMSRGWGIIL